VTSIMVRVIGYVTSVLIRIGTNIKTNEEVAIKLVSKINFSHKRV